MFKRLLKLLAIAGSGALLSALGYGAGSVIGQEALLTVSGLLAGLPLGTLAVTRRRRWLAVATLNLCLPLSYAAGGWPATGCVLAAVLLVLGLSTLIFQQLSGAPPLLAFADHVLSIADIQHGIQEIENGRTANPGKARSFGPQLVIVRPYNAVILESGGEQTGIRGPGVFRTRLFEYVKQSYDLRQRREPLALTRVLTQDTLPVTVHLLVSFGPNIPVEVRRGEASWGPSATEIVQLMDHRMPDLRRGVKAAVEESTRQVLGAITLEDLLRRTSFPLLGKQITDQANRWVRSWGGLVSHVIVESVQPQAEVMAAAAEGVVQKGRAAAWRDALRLLADGYKEAADAGMPAAAIDREAVRRTLEQIYKDPAAKIIFTPEMQGLLGDGRGGE